MRLKRNDFLMDIIFNCPKCDQELEVDSAGAGSEIPCPNCNETITIPQPGTQGTRSAAGRDTTSDIPAKAGGGHGHDAHAPINPIATSAAAKVEMHLKVPVHAKPSESLISKPTPPLEVAAKQTDKIIRVKTIRHTDCIEVGHDRFDEVVSQFLGKVGEGNIINVSSLTYTHIDIGSQKLLTDYAVMITYRG
jgi:DNA-directed RNA polymerase subunit RPC12/RpoP